MRNEQETLARKWAEQIRSAQSINSLEANAAADFILERMPPPSMADVEWDVDEMPGTGALTKHGRLWIMRDDAGDAIECISPDLEEIAFVAKKGLTPNGKRYGLREITDEPEHPEVLSTVEDYENAPEGTIVASNGKWEVPYMKQNGLWWRSGIACDNEYMARNCHPVMREGWGE